MDEVNHFTSTAMPHVHFLGEIRCCRVEASSVSVSWAVVPGNYSWFLREGLNFGETQTHCIPWTHIPPVPLLLPLR